MTYSLSEKFGLLLRVVESKNLSIASTGSIIRAEHLQIVNEAGETGSIQQFVEHNQIHDRSQGANCCN